MVGDQDFGEGIMEPAVCAANRSGEQRQPAVESFIRATRQHAVTICLCKDGFSIHTRCTHGMPQSGLRQCRNVSQFDAAARWQSSPGNPAGTIMLFMIAECSGVHLRGAVVPHKATDPGSTYPQPQQDTH